MVLLAFVGGLALLACACAFDVFCSSSCLCIPAHYCVSAIQQCTVATLYSLAQTARPFSKFVTYKQGQARGIDAGACRGDSTVDRHTWAQIAVETLLPLAGGGPSGQRGSVQGALHEVNETEALHCIWSPDRISATMHYAQHSRGTATVPCNFQKYVRCVVQTCAAQQPNGLPRTHGPVRHTPTAGGEVPISTRSTTTCARDAMRDSSGQPSNTQLAAAMISQAAELG